MESLSIIAIITLIQLGIIVVVEKFFMFMFFTNLTLFILLMALVISIGSVAIYYLVPFKGGAKNE